MRRRRRRSRPAARPSSANGGSSIALSPIAWRKQATVCSPSPACRQASGAAHEQRMRSSGCTRNSNEGSRLRPCCRRQIRPRCCSGRCSLPARSTCAKWMDGRRWPQSPSISQLTSQPETIPSCYRRSRQPEFQPHSGRHLGGRTETDDAAKSDYFVVRGILAKSVTEAARFIAERGIVEEGSPVLVRLITQLASRFGFVVSQKVAAQTIPVIGALGGAAINYAFIDHFQSVARGHFTVRRLERKYGKDLVFNVYERLRQDLGTAR